MAAETTILAWPLTDSYYQPKWLWVRKQEKGRGWVFQRLMELLRWLQHDRTLASEPHGGNVWQENPIQVAVQISVWLGPTLESKLCLQMSLQRKERNAVVEVRDSSRLGLVVRRSAGKRKDPGSTLSFGSRFSSKMVVYRHCLVILPCTIDETLKWFTSLCHLKAEILLVVTV